MPKKSQENYLGPVISDNPETLMILDAASMDAQPGSLAIIEMENIASSGLSTHSASLNLFLLVLQSEIQPDTFVLGIQPQTIEFGAPISDPVKKSLGTIERALLKILPKKKIHQDTITKVLIIILRWSFSRWI